MPERVDPYTKVLTYYFVPDNDGLDDTLVDLLTTDEATVSVVIEGNVPLTANEAIKLPGERRALKNNSNCHTLLTRVLIAEYVPFLILRAPPGDSSFSSFEKESSYSIDLNVGYGRAQDTAVTIEGSKTWEHTSEGEIEAWVGVGGGVSSMTLNYEVSDTDIEAESGYRHEKSGGKAFNKGNTVTYTSFVEYTTAEMDNEDWGDLFVTPR